MTPEIFSAKPMARREASAANITVRHCQGLAEFEMCLQLEKRIWGVADIEVVPLTMFVVAAETGGQVLGAFARREARGAGETLIGFTLAVAGIRGTKPFLHSHMTAVVEEYRNRGVGRQLKLFQRQDALARGIDLIEWTFDPLEIKNACFNLMRLGAIARRLLPNCYGITTSPLHGGLPTDRLVAEWWLASPRVEAILGGHAGGAEANRGPVGAQQLSRAESRDAAPPCPLATAAPRRIPVPATIGELREKNPVEARRVQDEIREQFQHWFARGYAATTLELTAEGNDYLLEPWSDS